VHNKKYSCPICNKEIPVLPRYPKYVCSECAVKASDKNGRLLKFSNTDISGGFIARYKDNGETYNSHICYIDGIICVADEGRFGGIVIEKGQTHENLFYQKLPEKNNRPIKKGQSPNTINRQLNKKVLTLKLPDNKLEAKNILLLESGKTIASNIYNVYIEEYDVEGEILTVEKKDLIVPLNSMLDEWVIDRILEFDIKKLYLYLD